MFFFVLSNSVRFVLKSSFLRCSTYRTKPVRICHLVAGFAHAQTYSASWSCEVKCACSVKQIFIPRLRVEISSLLVDFTSNNAVLFCY